jgi:colanic acid biosynthesis glycosyl transferase WcaI
MTLRRLAGVPYVLYVQDLWPETVTASGFIGNAKATRMVESGLNRYLRRLYRGASGVAAISPTMAATLADRGPRSVPVAVPNWIDEGVFAPAPAPVEPALPPGRTWIMYAGGIGEVQALQHAVRALALLPEGSDVGLALVGDGTARLGLRRLAEELQVTDRFFEAGPQPMERMPALMAEAAAQLISLRDLPLFRGTIPSKVQASMACAAPVICAVAGDAAELVERTESGLVVPPEDPVALAKAFHTMATMDPGQRRALGERGRRAYVSELGATAGATRLEELLSAAVAGASR